MEDQIDFDEIVQQMRQKIRKQRLDEADNPFPSPSDEQVEADLSLLHATADVHNAQLTSHRKILGSIALVAKKSLRRLLTPFLAQQVAYNRANNRLVTQLSEQLSRLVKDSSGLQSLTEKVEKLSQTIEKHMQTIIEVRSLSSELEQRIQNLSEKVTRDLNGQVQILETIETRVRTDAQAYDQALREMSDAATSLERQFREQYLNRHNRRIRQKMVAFDPGGDSSNAIATRLDSLRIADCFRDEVENRQRPYVQYFRGIENVLDIGCGRGEFLELLRESGIEAEGVELDSDAVLVCQEKGLKVGHEDAMSGLQSRANDSIGGIFAGQLIEHLLDRSVIQLITLAFQKLRPGGVILIDSINSQCAAVRQLWLWMRRTDIQPLHPDTVRFLLESVGFDEIVCEFSPPYGGVTFVRPLERKKFCDEDLHEPDKAGQDSGQLSFQSWGYAVRARKPR